ncbi:MAG: hypothetical protein JWP08_85 [Bryobacterales bacterium]|nr:hypothetical protein [Bryobacterales bacterium]
MPSPQSSLASICYGIAILFSRTTPFKACDDVRGDTDISGAVFLPHGLSGAENGASARGW